MSKKKSRKKLLIIVGLVMVGVGGYQMFLGGGAEGEPSKPKVSDELAYVEMKVFLAPIIDGRRISKFVAVGVVLELHSIDYDELVRDSMTALRNAFIDDSIFQAQMSSGRSDTIHLGRIKSRFCALADRILGPEVVREVLITHAMDRGF
ncbi:MAG: hypothetical protein CMM31_00665 [Rhodospirillaceae bacterium]|nr:hypothetical protein [Rhodospirillaceae bacterium]